MSQLPRVLICDDVHPCLLSGLSPKYQCDYRPDIKQAEVEDIIAAYEGIVINSKTRLHEPQLALATRLKWLARLGSGMEIIDQVYAKSRGIAVINTPAANANAVAEHALGMLLSLMHKLHLADASIRKGEWLRETHRGRELQDLTVGIIGYGNNGSRFAQKLSGLGVHVLIYDKYKQRIDHGLRFADVVELQELCERSDLISFHVPLTEETRSYFGGEFMQQCKRGLILINTSRGKVVDQRYLCEALESGMLSGACLDVFEDESESALESDTMVYLRESAAVILSPHVAGWTHESKERIAKTIEKYLLQLGFL